MQARSFPDRGQARPVPGSPRPSAHETVRPKCSQCRKCMVSSKQHQCRQDLNSKMKVLSCLTDTCDPVDGSLPGSSVHGIPQATILVVGSHSLLQGILPTQGLNPGLLHCRQILFHLSYKGTPRQDLGRPESTM